MDGWVGGGLRTYLPLLHGMAGVAFAAVGDDALLFLHVCACVLCMCGVGVWGSIGCTDAFYTGRDQPPLSLLQATLLLPPFCTWVLPPLLCPLPTGDTGGTVVHQAGGERRGGGGGGAGCCDGGWRGKEEEVNGCDGGCILIDTHPPTPHAYSTGGRTAAPELAAG